MPYPHHRLHHFKTREIFHSTAADQIATHLLEGLQDSKSQRSQGRGTEGKNAQGRGTHATASLFLSGGSTPGPIYKRLAHIPLPWQNINIALVDERWVDTDDKGSNAALISKTLLQERAVSAPFFPMKTAHKTARKGQDTVHEIYAPLFKVPSIATIGMGSDGHVCSWFPRAEGLDTALDPHNPAVTADLYPKRSSVTGNYLERISLTYSALLKCKAVILLTTGEAKLDLLKAALYGQKNDLPIAHLLKLPPSVLTLLHAN